jgi:hypothetical protein
MMPLLLAMFLTEVPEPAMPKLQAGLPEVVIADERPEGWPPDAIKLTLINRTKGLIGIAFAPHLHDSWFLIRFYDERGRPVPLLRTPRPFAFEGVYSLRLKPGESGFWYFSPKEDFIVPPGRYRIEVVYLYKPPGRTDRIEVVSNRITKTFP